MAAVASLLGITAEGAREVAQAVRRLNPIPSQGFYTGERDWTIVPEALIRYANDRFSIVMNDRAFPRLSVSDRYDDVFLDGPTIEGPDKEALAYVNQKKTAARRLVKALGDRERTLALILRQVIARQPVYFKEGVSLTPMKMGDIAEALELSASTVSRAVQGKYIVCAAGTVELKSLFSAGVKNPGGELLSVDFIKKRLKMCINAEDRRAPLSDQELSLKLRQMKIDISRRTVTKYRLAMNIPSAKARLHLG
jgi:RNA polymerase sigma-54 factor